MKILILAAMIAAGASAARAQADADSAPAAPASSPGRHMLTFGAGLTEPVSKVHFRSIGGGSADNGDLGIYLGAQYLYFPTPRLGAGFEADYVSRSGTLSTRLYPAADARVAGDAWLMLGVLRYSLRGAGKVRPFALVGAGGSWNKTTVDVRPSVWPDTATHETRRVIDGSAWAPAAAARLGLEIRLDGLAPGAFSVEAGWTGIAAARYAATPRGRALGLDGVSAPLHLLSFTARHSWRF